MERVYSPCDNVLEMVEEAADILDYTDSDIEAVKYPERELKVVIPVRMDGGTTKVFEGYRIQHSTSCGPAKGGIRFHPAVNPDEIKALAAWMISKRAVANILYGGNKGGAACDSNELSENEIRAITRRYTAAITPLVGSEQDIPAPDAGINTSVTGQMMDTYSILKGCCIHGVVTGKPICLGGALERNEATGRGVMYTTKNILNEMGVPAEGIMVAIQGTGNVGSIMAKLPHREGMKIIAASDVFGRIYNPDGFNVPAIPDYLSLNGKNLLKDYSEEGMSRITNEELLEMDVGVLMLAVLENQINVSNAYKIRAEVTVETANGLVVADANGILQDRGITVVPDALVNAGGVVVSCLEWAQNIQSVSWTEEEVNEKLKDIMGPAFGAVRDIAMKQNVILRTGAYLVAVKRVAEAKVARAIWL